VNDARILAIVPTTDLARARMFYVPNGVAAESGGGRKGEFS
jgi:hypothetical protein